MNVINEQSSLSNRYVLGLNHMSDWSEQEYLNMLGVLPQGKKPEVLVENQGRNQNAKEDHFYTDRPTNNNGVYNQRFLQSLPIDLNDIDLEKIGKHLIDKHGEEIHNYAKDKIKNHTQEYIDNAKNYIADGAENTKKYIEEGIEKHTGIKIKIPDFSQHGLHESSWVNSQPSIISPVKDQGRNCSASYAFAVVAALEAAQAKENGLQAIQLSEQQIIDCSSVKEYRNYGCLGGTIANTVNYVKANSIYDIKTYPYVERHQPHCDDD